MPPERSGVTVETKHALEREAVGRLRAMLGAHALATELEELWTEYEEGTSATARFVKDLDKAEMLLQADAYERAGCSADLEQFYTSTLHKIQTASVREVLVTVMAERRQRTQPGNALDH